MRKYLLAVCLLFAMTGCAEKTDSPAMTHPETESSVVQTVVETAAVTQRITETVQTSETEDITQSDTAETEASASQIGIPAVPETMEVHETLPHEDGTLLGIWKWTNLSNTHIVFRENGSALMRIDDSSVMQFENHMLQYNGVPCDTFVAGDRVTAELDGETILQMSALEGASAQDLQGEFLLEDCAVYQGMAHGNPDAVYYVLLEEGKFYIEALASYTATEDALQLSWAEDQLSANYFFVDGHLCLAYDDGSSEVLERVE